MRLTLTLAAIAALAVAIARAEDSGARGKAAPTDDAIIDTCGVRLARLFARFGAPQDILAKRGSMPNEDDVLLDYGSFLFRIRDKTVRNCFFLNDWKGPIRGIKIGDSTDEAKKVLGAPRVAYKNKDGTTDYQYDLKDLDATFWANFDKDGKLKRVEIDLKD
jgi:hypothetical protein